MQNKFKSVGVARQRVKRKDEGVVAIQETPLPKAAKRAKNTPLSEIEEAALDIILSSKKADTGKGKSIPRLPAKNKSRRVLHWRP